MSLEKKHIGILGLGNRSTLYYINQINQFYQKIYGGYSTCPFILYNENFNKFNPYLPNQFNKILPELRNTLLHIETLGIHYLLVPNITLHESLDQIETALRIAHPLELSINALKNNKQTKAIIFGTKYTMNSTYINGIFKENNIKIISPTKSEQKFIDELRTALYQKNENDDELTKYQKLITKYTQDTPVLIACTELSLISKANSHFLIDMAHLQIQDFVRQFRENKNDV